jgi:flagellar motor switch protein FliM
MNPDSSTPALIEADPSTLGDGPNPFIGEAAPAAPDAPPPAQPYDFRNPLLLSPTELRKMRIHQEDFIQSAASRLSIHLRSEFVLTLSGIQTIAYQKYAESWGRPSHLTLFKMEPMRGVSILEITSQLGFCMVDRLMGGPGQAPAAEQEISEIEKVLLEQTAQMIMEEWCGHWVGIKELKPGVLGYESNGRFIQNVTPETVMLVIGMEAAFGDCAGKFQLGVPYLAMEPLIQKYCQGNEAAPAPAKTPPPAPASFKWNACFDDVAVPVTAEWDGMELTAREILALKVGDVIPMGAQRMQQVNVRVADTLKFQGRPGTLDGQWAVELTQVINR